MLRGGGGNQNQSNGRAWINFLHLIILIASTGGCIYHIRLVTEVYLKKEVITDIRIQFSEVARVPDLSICLYFYNFVSYKNLKDSAPRIFSKLRAKFPSVSNQTAFNEWKFSTEAIAFLTMEFSRLTINELMKTMIDTNELIEKIEPTIRQIDMVDKMPIKNDCRVLTTIKEPYICMTVHCPLLSKNLLSQKDLELTQLLGTVMAIYFKHNLFATTEEYYVFLHPANTLPYGSQMSSVTIVTEENPHKFYIEYKIFEANLLPAPYTTNCANYSSIGYHSQRHALEYCRNSLSMKTFGCGFYSDVVNASSRARLAITDYYLNYGDPRRRKIINEIYDNCTLLHAAPDCKLEYFVPRIQKVARIDSESTILYLSMPTEPDITNTCQPKLPLFEYLIFIGSILGTWFGFNVLNSSPSIIKWVCSFFGMLTSSKKTGNYILGDQRLTAAATVNTNSVNNVKNNLTSKASSSIGRWNEVKRNRSSKSWRQNQLKATTWEEYLRIDFVVFNGTGLTVKDVISEIKPA